MSLVDKEKKQEQGKRNCIICMKCTIPFKLHVLGPDEKEVSSIQLRNESGNDKVKLLYCNKQRTEAGSE